MSTMYAGLDVRWNILRVELPLVGSGEPYIGTIISDREEELGVEKDIQFRNTTVLNKQGNANAAKHIAARRWTFMLSGFRETQP